MPKKTDLKGKRKVLICTGTGCVLSGSLKVRGVFEAKLKRAKLDKEIGMVSSGCHGFCSQGPIVVVYPEGIFYPRVEPEQVARIVDEHLRRGNVVEGFLYTDPNTGKRVPEYRNVPFYKKQKRIVLRNCGVINPERIEEYEGRGGYSALSQALSASPEEVIEEIKKSGLRGRGGAGFSTGLKWEFARKAPGDKKYMICNADEGDPGAFMDRSVLEGDPHAVLEGVIIAAYAIGASEGYIYVRAEYPLAVKRLRIAISQARE
ncbi:MAG: NAD(P)H-dependent oxidoreductase subunit E, partial [Actinomycetota bacterium]|nr:NAD(P)H-dependent oxidoreductase subunit E [Actinomycetota bacterium]